MTRTKLETCLSLEIKLKRQEEKMSWLDCHIDDQYHVVVSRINDSIDGGNNSSDNSIEIIQQKLQNYRNYNFYKIGHFIIFIETVTT